MLNRKMNFVKKYTFMKGNVAMLYMVTDKR